MTDFNVTDYDKFTLMGVKTRVENGELITTAPVAAADAAFYALECINTLTGVDHVFNFDVSIKDPLEVLDFLNMNDHIKECGIEKLY